ncbi:hypothetical protein NXW90_22550 [Bacteroides fragilis]|nr:hypothetical protein [Bacteroides fragilis]
MGLCLTGALTACDLDVGSTYWPLQQKETFRRLKKIAWYALNTCCATLDGPVCRMNCVPTMRT